MMFIQFGNASEQHCTYEIWYSDGAGVVTGFASQCWSVPRCCCELCSILFFLGYVSAFSELLQGSLPALESVWQLQSLNKTDRSRHRARSGAVSLCKSTALEGLPKQDYLRHTHRSVMHCAFRFGFDIGHTLLISHPSVIARFSTANLKAPAFAALSRCASVKPNSSRHLALDSLPRATPVACPPHCTQCMC